MRSNFILLFPFFIFSIYHSYLFEALVTPKKCSDFKVSSKIQGTCKGSNNGNIELEIKGGISPYKIKWSNGKTTKRIDGLAEGTYSVLVMDSEGCQWEKLFRLASFLELTASIKEKPTSGDQDNGGLEVRVSGGKPPYVYHLINNTGIINEENKNTNKLTNLSKGKYTVAVTDNNRCTSVFNATVR